MGWFIDGNNISRETIDRNPRDYDRRLKLRMTTVIQG